MTIRVVPVERDDLLPCPFCARPPRQQIHYADGDSMMQPYLAVHCEHHTQWITVEQWNKRAATPAADGAEPVAWMTEGGSVCAGANKKKPSAHGHHDNYTIPLYTALRAAEQPSRNAVLEEIANMVETSSPLMGKWTLASDIRALKAQQAEPNAAGQVVHGSAQADGTATREPK
mgnify:CR=1 FL=1